MGVKGKMEEEITRAMTQIQKEQTGRGANEGKTFIVNDMVIVRLRGVLTPAERQLANAPDGCKLIKELRYSLEKLTRSAMEAMIFKITGLKVVSVHNDISTKTGERLDVFILEQDLESLVIE